jgi:hypothetical protein
METIDYWERYQKTQSVKELTTWLKHRAWVQIEEEKRMAEDDFRYDKTYLAEKAEAAKRSAEEILGSLERPNSAASRSYIIAGCLGLEMALMALHTKARQIMAQCGETEADYSLRPMGEVVRGGE